VEPARSQQTETRIRESTFGLTRRQLADLLSFAAEDQIPTKEATVDRSVAEELHRMLVVAVQDDEKEPGCPSSQPGRSLRHVLLKEKSPPSELVTIKEQSKRWTTGSASSQERAAGTTVYYAAIASSLIQHGEKISQHSYDALAQSFLQLSAKSWMLPELKDLFDRATTICQERREMR